MSYVLIHQSLFVWINRSDELSVWRIKRSQLYLISNTGRSEMIDLLEDLFDLGVVDRVYVCNLPFYVFSVQTILCEYVFNFLEIPTVCLQLSHFNCKKKIAIMHLNGGISADVSAELKVKRYCDP